MTIATKERPIIFSGEMVPAILRNEKSQTRRVIKPQPTAGQIIRRSGIGWGVEGCMGNYLRDIVCPFKVGLRLWVRETLWRNGGYVATDSPPFDNCGKISSRYMPRRDSRILLEITKVRVERVNELTRDDAIAEGVKCDDSGVDPVVTFAILWDGINKKRGFPWQSNPFVWALTFRVVSDSEKFRG